MKKMILSIAFLAASAAAQGQVDRVCRAYCTMLSVQGGTVRFIEQSPEAPRDIALGRYMQAEQHFVPRTEAPIRNLRSQRGWRIVISAFLHHDAENEGLPGVRLHFFDPSGMAEGTDDALMSVDQTEIGRLFGGSDEIFAITTSEEHAYNTQTKVFLLPETGRPKLLLAVGGDLRKFGNGAGNSPPGLTIARQTYDGVHSETKGTVPEFYAWNRETKSLELQKR
jgi:hypothetical protein